MMMRLETVAKDLAARLRTATSSQQRAASLLACQLALQAAPIDSHVVVEAVKELQTKGVLSIQRVTELNGLVAQLDQEYFDLQDRSEDEPDLQPEALRLFSQARAVSALSLAGGNNTLAAALESIYESGAAVDDANSVYEAVRKLF